MWTEFRPNGLPGPTMSDICHLTFVRLGQGPDGVEPGAHGGECAIRVKAHRDDLEKLSLVLPGTDEPLAPTHWSFGRLSSLVGEPAAYLRQLPVPRAGINLQYGLTTHRTEPIKTMEVANGRTEMRAVTGPDYGRIYHRQGAELQVRIAVLNGDTALGIPVTEAVG